jgi:hypothetical protein
MDGMLSPMHVGTGRVNNRNQLVVPIRVHSGTRTRNVVEKSVVHQLMHSTKRMLLNLRAHTPDYVCTTTTATVMTLTGGLLLTENINYYSTG